MCHVQVKTHTVMDLIVSGKVGHIRRYKFLTRYLNLFGFKIKTVANRLYNDVFKE